MYNLDKTSCNLAADSVSADTEMTRELLAGEVIAGQFEVVRKLGSGGMSSVYLCTDLFVERSVAVKVLYANQVTNPKALNRFRREARAIARLDHPNIVRLHAFNFDLSSPYIVMEHVDGITLAQLIVKVGAMSLEQTLSLAEQLCGALQYAHENGVIHRDLKPSNIIVEHYDPMSLQIKVLDFGIAKMSDDTMAGATATGELFGTPAYMSPEQALGKTVDRRSDQYSLGCLFFECLTGNPPFVGSGQLSVLMQHVQSPVPVLAESNFSGRYFPTQLQAVLDKMLAKFPEDRYESMDAVFEHLCEHSEEDYVVAFSELIASAKKDTNPKTSRNKISALSDPTRITHSSLRITEPPRVVQSGFKASKLLVLIAITSASVLLIGATIAAVYLATNMQGPAPTPQVPQDYISTDHLLGGIDVPKAFGSNIEHQLRLDRQRTSLIVQDPATTDPDLRPLLGARSIKDLTLSYCEKVSDAGLPLLYHLPLVALNMKCTAVTDNGVVEISRHFPELHFLGLEQCNISDKAISYLPALKDLNSVSLRLANVKHCGEDLSKVRHLENLLIDETQFDFQNFYAPELRKLFASHVNVNDGMIETIARHKRLEFIGLGHTGINDNQLLKLASLSNLKEIRIPDCANITASGIAKFKRVNPKCKLINIDAGESNRQAMLDQWTN